jgi:uncharacterized protein (TIGR03435 family)
MTIILALLTLLAASPAGFEVASITPCKPGTPEPPAYHMGMVQFTYPGGRFQASATTVEFLMEWAYKIQPSQHSAGPSWLKTERYDIVAKAEGNPSDDQMREMVKALLADRFKLKVQAEKKKIVAYVISKGKTEPRLYPAKEGEVHGIRIAPVTGPGDKIVSRHVIVTRYSLAQFTDVISRQLGRPMVNETGLDGDLDFTIDFATDDEHPNPLDPGTVLTAMREQLGLVVNAKTTEVDYLAIDSAEKVTAGNQ